MKKFFTLCLAFMLASLLNMNAADTYTLVGENINGKKWDVGATENDLVYDASTDSYSISGVTMSGKFKIAKDHAWTTAWGNNEGRKIPIGAAYIAWAGSNDIELCDAQTYNNCTVTFKILNTNAASIRITSSTPMQAAIDTRADAWCVAGTFSDNEWNDAYEMTDLGNGVYELWSTELPSEFKFKAKGDWSISFGMNGDIKNTPIMGFDNALTDNGANISLATDQVYDKYRYTLTVRGMVASFRVDGYKEAVPSLTRVFYESFDGVSGTGGNDDDKWSDNDANTDVSTSAFDNKTGWSVTKGYAGNKCIKLGTTSAIGTITSPALGVTGNAELRFKAGAWNNDSKTLTITINNGGTLSASSVTLVNNAFTDYTISISDATPESTITFSAAKANKNRFFLDEVEVYANSSELSAAEITLNGVMKDAETAYYHGSLANPTVTVTLPAGATYMDVEVDNSGYITESRKNQTSDCTIPFYNAGNYTVRVTAYGEGVYSVASKDIAIETVSSVYSFDELINKGEGAIGYLNLSPIVAAHIGKYLYIEGIDWDGIRSSALVYASLDKTYKKGDVLQGFIATVSYYNGNPQLTPLTTSLGDPYSYSEPYVYEVEAGKAWKAFAEEANVNKYVRVKNAPVTANPDAVDGVTAYTKHLGVNMPDDVKKKYDVEGFINNYKGTIQIQPISFTAIEEEKIEPFTYTEIFPANNTEVTSLSEIKITFPYNVTYDAEVGVLVMDGNNMITHTVAVEGNVATLTFDAITAYGSKPSLMVMAGAFKASGVGCEQIVANWSIPTPPVRNDYMPIKIDPADGTVVESIKNIYFYFDDENPCVTSKGYDAPYKGYVTVKDGNGNAVASDVALDVVKIKGTSQWIGHLQPKYGSSYTEPGTYVITLAEGLFSDQQYYDEDGKKGRVNPEFTITYTIKAAALAAPTVDPANGAEVENPSTVTLTFAEAVTVNAEAGALTMVNTSDAAYDYAKNFNVAISEDGLTATITCEPGYPDSAPRWAIGKTYKLNIPAGYFVATSGAASEALEYSWKVVPAPFKVASTTPEVGEVEKLDVINIFFTENRVYSNIGYSWASLELVDNAGQVVTTGSVTKDGNYVGDVFKSYLIVTLAQPVTTPGQYTLVIPEGYARNVEWGEGAINVATNLTWTVMEPDPNTYDLALTSDPANGATVTELKTIKISAADASVIAMPTTEAQSAGWFTIKDAEGNSYNYTANTGLGIEIHIEGATAPGTYTVVVPAKSFVDAMTMTAASKRYNAEMVLTYTLQEEEEVDNTVYDMTLVSAKPANGSEVESLETIKLTFNYDDSINLRFAAKNTGWITVTDEAGNNYDAYMDDNWDGYVGDYIIYVSGATQPGTYTVTIPKGTVADDSYMNKEPYFLQGHANPEFTLTYTLVAPVVEDFTPVINPTAGNVTKEQIKTTVLSFESPIASFDDSDVRYAKPLYGSVWCSVAGSYTISEDKLSLTINWDFSPEVGLTYTLELPAGCIVLENGAKNLFTQVAYTVVAGPKDLAEFVVPAGMNGYINYDETDVNAWAPEFPFTVSTTAYNTVAFTAELPSLPAGITAMEVIDENGEVIAILNQDGVAPLADGEIYYVKGETTKEYVDGAELKFRFRFTHLGVSETIQFSYIIAGGNITSIADVELDGNVIVRGNDIIAPQGAAIFTVSGIRVPAEGLAPGVYVVVLGNQAVKVMVK